MGKASHGGLAGWAALGMLAVLLLVSTGEAVSATPPDPLNHWSFRYAGQFNRVRFVNGLFIAVGPNGQIATSPDGTAWTPRSSGTTANLSGVTSGLTLQGLSGVFVVVGSGGTLLSSTDAVTWAKRGHITQDLNDVAGNENTLVATATATASGQPNVFWANGVFTWTGATLPSNPTYTSAIGVAGQYFITAAGSSFAYDLWRSTDGTTWQNVGFSDAVVKGIAYGNGRVIVVGWEGWPRVSTDQGASWTAVVSPDISSTNHMLPIMVGSDIAFGNGLFLVSRSFLQNGILTTADGLNWTNRALFTGATIDSVAYGNGTFVVTCSDGGSTGNQPGIYQSDSLAVPWLTLTPQTNPAAVVLNASGEIGRGYRLQCSADLQTWTNRAAYTGTATGFQLVDPVPPGSTQLFYRVVSP